MVVVFGLDDCDGYIWLVTEDVIGPLGFTARNQFSTDDDPPLCERHFFTNLQHPVPTRSLDRRADKFATDIAFAEFFFVHRDAFVPRCMKRYGFSAS